MTATYRLQLHAGFTFEDARALVPYLADLGVTHLYLSPILAAADGSTHGYDVVNPDRVSAALGGEAGFDALVEAAANHGLQILLDIVPNHMSIAGTQNAWWMDVLENGPASYFAHYFDVDWGTTGDDRVTLPVLGERYGRALASGALALVYDDHGFAIRAGEARYPIAPESLGGIVRRVGERARAPELAFIGDALSALPRETSHEARRRRHRDKRVLAHRLGELGMTDALRAEVVAVNADKVELDAVLEAQAYRFVHWSVSSSQLTYRRFFDINTLVGLRIEQLDVFEARHERVLGWLRDGTIDGVRIDHVDGLRDPGEYLARLRERAPDAWIVVEKILGADEPLPAWPIEGTTGYEFGERIGALLVDPAGEAPLTALFEDFTGTRFDVEAGRRAARREVASDALHSEIARLVELAARACRQTAATRDFTRAEIGDALVEIIAGYRVYRTYLTERASASEPAAAAAHSTHVPAGDPDLVAFLAAALAGDIQQPDARALALAAQQVTGAVVAKGDEDTASYRLVRLASRCEVGADLAMFSLAPEQAHRAFAAAPPRGLLATSTHDTKRGEDTRMRIAVLSERPDAWRAFVTAARARATSYWGDVAPDRTLEYLMWQTLVGAWPLPVERALEYAHKAAREARTRTSWRAHDEAYEAAMRRWVTGVLADAPLCADLAAFVATIAPRARANSLAQLLVKLTAPGVPDLYQGSELAELTLVDPDNRRAVDRTHVDELGRDKLATIRRVLGLRRTRPALFDAPYRALAASGPHAERVFAFTRGDELLAIVPRIGEVGPEAVISLPEGAWRDVLSDRDHAGGSTAVARLWATFPVALLHRTRAA